MHGYGPPGRWPCRSEPGVANSPRRPVVELRSVDRRTARDFGSRLKSPRTVPLTVPFGTSKDIARQITGEMERTETVLAEPVGGASRLVVELPKSPVVSAGEVDLYMHFLSDIMPGLFEEGGDE